MVDSNTVYIGTKPPMNYVTAIMALFNSGNFDEITIKARGNAISRAVDVAEITRNRFVTDAQIKSIQIGTESIVGEEGRKSNVSSIEICLLLKKQKNKSH
ncbi:MAG: DNA-binding protein Alba [Candidatus Thermoplasmatota archaeon]